MIKYHPEDDGPLAHKYLKMYTVYLLESVKSSRSYVGYTEEDVIERLSQHNNGSNRWTRMHKPFTLIYYETFVCKTDALRREKFLKSGQGKKLRKIILEYFKPGA